MTKRIQVSMSDEFYDMLVKYKAWRGLPSLSAAAMELSALGASQMVKTVPPLRASWGGSRRGDDWEAEIDREMETLERVLMGLPPEPMDDEENQDEQ
jgi:hypothetical protein